MTKYTRWQSAILTSLIWLAGINCQAQSSATPKQPKEPRLTSIRAMLFFENTGKFSPDVFTNEVNLWNTPIEGASREGASESMLVVVEVTGERDWRPAGRKVQLIARYRIADKSGYGKPAYFSKTMKVNIGSDDKFFAPFWLYETGCHPVKLTARIVGQKQKLEKTINLRCGE
jgi:hypothetical protein